VTEIVLYSSPFSLTPVIYYCRVRAARAPPYLFSIATIYHTTTTIMTDNKTASRSQGEKRNRVDDEGRDRIVSQRITESVVEDTAKSKALICKLVLTDLWDPDICEKRKAMIRLLVETNGIDDAKHAEKQKQFYRVGGHLAVVKVMSLHPACNVFQEYGIKILVGATYKNEELKLAVADVGGVTQILSAMAHFPMNSDITVSGFKALSNLCLHTPNAKLLVCELNGIPLILERLVGYKAHCDVVLWACRLIQKLCSVETLRKTLFEANTLSVLSTTAEYWKAHSSIRATVSLSIEALVEHLKSLA